VALFGNFALISTINDDTAALNAGAAYLFDTTTGALLHTFLNPTPELNNSFGNNDNFGFSVALSGTQLAIGAPNDIDGAPQIHVLARNPDDHFVEMPSIARSRTAPSQSPGNRRSEFEHPTADALIGDVEPALGKQLLDIAIA
jgi:hypothetical protein